MRDTQLVFVVGSGRCGTRMIKTLFSGVEHIEARHEYMRNAFQREAALYHMGRCSRSQIANLMLDTYGSASHYSPAKYFMDSNQHLSWIVDVLAETFPAKFVHLVRDGRKVVSSFFHKLSIFDDRSAQITRDWLRNGGIWPPKDEKFWQIAAEEPDMFKRICVHWRETNKAILSHIPANSIRVKLEDLSSDKAELEKLLNFVDVPYDNSFMDAMQKPKHVYVPVDYPLTEEQTETFNAICGDMMKTLGYEGKEEYRVNYQM
jgi:hypothetical protein